MLMLLHVVVAAVAVAVVAVVAGMGRDIISHEMLNEPKSKQWIRISKKRGRVRGVGIA